MRERKNSFKVWVWPGSLEGSNGNICRLSLSFCFRVDVEMLLFSSRVKFPHLKVIVGFV